VLRVIVIVYSLFFFLPVLLYQPDDGGPFLATQMLHAFSSNSSISPFVKGQVVSEYVTRMQHQYGANALISLVVTPFEAYPIINRVDLLSSVRAYETVTIAFSSVDPSGTVFSTSALFNHHSFYARQAGCAILLYLFIAVILISGYGIITADVQRLVLAPIERMMNMVDEVSRNPLQKLHFDPEIRSGGEYEMRLLERSLEKITSLLRVGFGEAGAGIIRANLNMQDGTCTINPLLPGVRVYAIFGFCAIHDFEFATQQLSNEVLTFVNKIAEIVHSNIHNWRGQCNKNLGNAFIVVWRIGDQSTLLASYSSRASIQRDAPFFMNRSPHSSKNTRGYSRLESFNNAYTTGTGAAVSETKKKKEVDLSRVPDIERWADHSLISYLKIIASLNRSKEILKYRSEPRLTLSGAQEFKVRMGFGLHAGWAIEGAVGSLQKVDATYLSPHVNMAARLETASKQYGVAVLISQNVYELMSDEAKELCRRIDKVTVKGSTVPIDIYTYDCWQDQAFKEERKKNSMDFKHAGTKYYVIGTR
jgi:class 3 adenylate cyclase